MYNARQHSLFLGSGDYEVASVKLGSEIGIIVEIQLDWKDSDLKFGSSKRIEYL